MELNAAGIVQIVALIKGIDEAEAQALVAQIPWPEHPNSENLRDSESDSEGVSGAAVTLKSDSASLSNDSKIEVGVDQIFAKSKDDEVAIRATEDPAESNLQQTGAGNLLGEQPVATANLDNMPSHSQPEMSVIERLKLDNRHYRIVRRKPQNEEDRDALNRIIPPSHFHSYMDVVDGNPDRAKLAEDAKTDFRKSYSLFLHWAKQHEIILNRYDSFMWFLMLYLGEEGIVIDQDEEKEFHGMLMPVDDGSATMITYLTARSSRFALGQTTI